MILLHWDFTKVSIWRFLHFRESTFRGSTVVRFRSLLVLTDCSDTD